MALASVGSARHRPRRSTGILVVLGCVLALGPASCGGETPATGDRDLGDIDDTLGFADRINWPGFDTGGGRTILFITGFSNGGPIGYWFFGFGQKRTADAFFFCRQGDSACPLDEHRRIDFDRMPSKPIFTKIPGDPEFSAFWAMWTVTVPADYQPDSIKTIETLHAMDLAGKIKVAPFIFDHGVRFGENVGPAPTVAHCSLVLKDTAFQKVAEPTPGRVGEPMPDGRGNIMALATRLGWFQGHRVHFIDFSASDGIFPEAAESESRSLMRFANIYILWRRCATEPRPAICDLPGFAYPDRRPVSERGLGQDITGNKTDQNTANVFGAMPCALRRPTEQPYSPLWGPQATDVTGVAPVGLIDTYRSQTEGDIKSADDLFRHVAEGKMTAPKPMLEDETGNPVPGNEGRVFFDCPAVVREGFVPYPCADDP